MISRYFFTMHDSSNQGMEKYSAQNKFSENYSFIGQEFLMHFELSEKMHVLYIFDKLIFTIRILNITYLCKLLQKES